jgi:hypothetical protein
MHDAVQSFIINRLSFVADTAEVTTIAAQIVVI